MYDGAESEAVSPAGGHVGDPDTRVVLGDAAAPQLQRLHTAPLSHLRGAAATSLVGHSVWRGGRGE